MSFIVSKSLQHISCMQMCKHIHNNQTYNTKLPHMHSCNKASWFRKRLRWCSFDPKANLSVESSFFAAFQSPNSKIRWNQFEINPVAVWSHVPYCFGVCCDACVMLYVSFIIVFFFIFLSRIVGTICIHVKNIWKAKKHKTLGNIISWHLEFDVFTALQS